MNLWLKSTSICGTRQGRLSIPRSASAAGVQALLQQAFRQDAKRREWEQHEARLVRVAALDDAALFRSTHSARQHQILKSKLRQSIQLAAC